MDEVVLAGIGTATWGARDDHRMPFMRMPARSWESIACAIGLALAGKAVTAAPRVLPRVRTVLATLDPTIGFAASWAEACGAELWVYGIDLHCSSFWGAGTRLQGLLEQWRTRAFAQASRGFALSDRLAAWMRGRGFRGPISLLPPLVEVDEAAPSAPRSGSPLLFAGWVYSANARPLKWVEQAHAGVRPNERIRLLTHTDRRTLTSLGLDLARWAIQSVPAERVRQELYSCSWGIAALDPQFTPREKLSVAWPSKLRDYLAAARPVICIAGDDYALADLAKGSEWAVVARDEESTHNAVRAALLETQAKVEARSTKAHAFAKRTMNSNTVGKAFRDLVLEGGGR
jgi:hypothetical protein